jgi:NADH-quinone oxidoreductase subunit C
MAQKLIELVRNKFSDAVLGSHSQHGDDTVIIDANRWLELGQFLRDDPACDMALLVDLTAVDFPQKMPRFEVVAHLASLRLGHRLRVKARVGNPDGSSAQIDSWSALWGSANWAERECYDLMGIEFRGHPDLRRILMYPEFVGHPYCLIARSITSRSCRRLDPVKGCPSVGKLTTSGLSSDLPLTTILIDLEDRTHASAGD